MRRHPELIVMLTHNDHTVENARELFEQGRGSDARFWGMKEKGLPLNQMKSLYAYMKDCGMKTVLEVVAYSSKECLEGARIAAECGCDILMGTKFSEQVNIFCKDNHLKYMPFVGDITGRPSVLNGEIECMIDEANEYLSKGVYGIDLLAYRYPKDPSVLIQRFISLVEAPVCIAGSIDRPERLNEVIDASPWAFTIGGAFFEKRFGDSFSEQINHVCHYAQR